MLQKCDKLRLKPLTDLHKLTSIHPAQVGNYFRRRTLFLDIN